MAHYRFFLFLDGRLVDRVASECASDQDALGTAVALCGTHSVEIYQETRLVGRVAPGGEVSIGGH